MTAKASSAAASRGFKWKVLGNLDARILDTIAHGGRWVGRASAPERIVSGMTFFDSYPSVQWSKEGLQAAVELPSHDHPGSADRA